MRSLVPGKQARAPWLWRRLLVVQHERGGSAARALAASRMHSSSAWRTPASSHRSPRAVTPTLARWPTWPRPAWFAVRRTRGPGNLDSPRAHCAAVCGVPARTHARERAFSDVSSASRGVNCSQVTVRPDGEERQRASSGRTPWARCHPQSRPAPRSRRVHTCELPEPDRPCAGRVASVLSLAAGDRFECVDRLVRAGAAASGPTVTISTLAEHRHLERRCSACRCERRG